MQIRPVEEFNWGVYVAKSHDRYIKDTDENYLCIASRRNDTSKIKKLVQTAKSYGLDGISVEFRGGASQISEEEYQYQKAAMESGLVLPEYDPGLRK